MSHIITRKFGLDTDNLKQVQHIFLKFRDFENRIIATVLSHADNPDFVKHFKRKAKMGYKIAYDHFKINHLASQTYLRLEFKERMKRAAMYYPYFAIRTYLVRKHNLAHLLDLLKGIFQDTPSEYISFLKKGTLPRTQLIHLQHALSRNVYEERQSLSMEYLADHLRQLRTLLVKNMGSNREIQAVLKTTFHNPSRMTPLISTTLQGFTTQRKRREIKINQEDLQDHLKKRFLTAIKRKSSRLFKMYKEKDLSKAKSPLLQMIRTIGTANMSEFKQDRESFLVSVEISKAIDLRSLCHEVLADISETMVSAENPLYRLLAFQFKPIPITSLDEAGFIAYLKMKLRYQIMSQLPARMFHTTSGIVPPVLSTIDELKTQLSEVLKKPRINNLTINLPFREQLWKHVPTDGDKLKPSFLFTPLKKSTTTFFRFRLSRTPRKEAGFPEDLYRSPPILKLDHRKLLLIQPFEQKGMEIPKSTGNREMGIDLGLKHFAVLSIRDTQNGDEVARYFLGQKALFGYTFTPDKEKFIPQSGINWNIKRKLIHLRNEVREVQSKKALYELQFSPDGKRHYHIAKTLSCLWDKIHRIHLEIRNQLTHRILQIAQLHDVSLVKFEDLSWSKHSKKEVSGTWIAYHQIHWFHSKIIQHVRQAAKRIGITVGVVNARWSSQICAHCAKGKDPALKITLHSKKGHLQECFGSRTGKQFRCTQKRSPARGFHSKLELDADLNAARNVSMRSVIRVLS